MTTALPDPRCVTEPTTGQTGKETRGPFRWFRDLMVTAEQKRVGDSGEGPARWVMNTGEGTAIAAGSRQIQNLDVDKVFGDNFGHAVESVIATNQEHPDLSGAERLRSTQEAYRQRLSRPKG